MEQIREVYFNHKGGAGKSTTAYLKARYNQTKGRRTLLIDADPQASTTSIFFKSRNAISSYDAVLLGEKDADGNDCSILDFIVNVGENLDLLPAGRSLVACEKVAESKIRKIAKTMVRELKGYDSIIIDSPPALNSLSALGIFLAQWVVLPVELDFFPYKALQEANETIQDIVDIHDDHKGVIYFLNKVKKGRQASIRNQFAEKYKTDLGDKLMDVPLIDNVTIYEAPFLGMTHNLFEQKKVNADILNFFETQDQITRGA